MSVLSSHRIILHSPAPPTLPPPRQAGRFGISEHYCRADDLFLHIPESSHEFRVLSGIPAFSAQRCANASRVVHELASSAAAPAGSEHPNTDSPAKTAVKTLFPEIKIFTSIGSGHFGEVFLGIFRQHVYAVKATPLPDPSCTSPRCMQLLRESLSPALEPHRNLIRAHASFVQDHVYYLLMDFADGGSLSQLLAARQKHDLRMQLTSAVSILLQLARAVRHLHHRGIVHRDVKPDNILFCSRSVEPLRIPAAVLADPERHQFTPHMPRAGVDAPVTNFRVKLADFGLMRRCDGQTGTTIYRPGLTVGAGTRLWMAPEVSRRDGHYGRATDIYSWGVVALELLSGQPASLFRKGGVSVDPATVTSLLPPKLPGELTELVVRSLSTEPRLRPKADDIVARLKPLLPSNSDD